MDKWEIIYISERRQIIEAGIDGSNEDTITFYEHGKGPLLILSRKEFRSIRRVLEDES